MKKLLLLAIFLFPIAASAQVFGQNQLLPIGTYGGGFLFSTSTNGTHKITSTSSPTAGYYTATSTTGTSTLPRLAVGTALNFFGTFADSLDDLCVAITGGSGLCDGTDATGGGGGTGTVATSSQETAGQVAVWGTTNGYPAGLYSVGTSTPTVGSEFSYSGTLGKFIGGTDGALSLATNGTPLTKLAQIAANTILGNGTGSTGNVTAIATSSLFSGSLGQVLAQTASGWVGVATTTFSGGLTYSGGNVTADLGTSITVGELASADFGNFTCNGSACTIDNTSVTNGMLANSSVSYGGVSVALGASDATPAFDLTDATLLPIVGGTTGTLTIARGGTGTTTAPVGQLLYGGASAYQSVATSTGTCTSASGITCTNFSFVGAGGSTFALSAIPNSSLANSTISGIALGSNLAALTAGAGLTSAGTFTGATTRTFDIDFTRANSWTGLQQFANASSSLFSANYAQFGGTATSTFTTDGRLGIGSSTPWALFSVNPTSAIGTSPILAIGSSTATHFYIGNDGKVGVGTTSPTKTFSVNGEIFNNSTTTTTGLNVLAPTTSTSTVYIYSKTAGFGGQIILEDTDAAGCTEVTALNGVLAAKIATCPTEL
jgi:hypothetical protein